MPSIRLHEKTSLSNGAYYEGLQLPRVGLTNIDMKVLFLVN